MNGSEMQLAAPAVQAVAWALVHFLWQGALAGLAAAALLWVLRGAKAATRYAVAVTLLLLLSLLPVGTALRLAGSPPNGAIPAFATPQPGAAPPAFAGVAAQGSPSLAAATENALVAPAALARLLAPALPYVFGAWLLGVLLIGLAHLGGWWRIQRLVRRAHPLDGEVAERLHRLGRRLGLGRVVRLLESAAVPVPAVIGWVRPAILVPASTLAGLSPWQLDAILAHELAHIHRLDPLVNLFQAVVETLLFYHPAVWWLSNEVRRERESCCDDLAVELCGDRLGYARALAELEGLRLSPPRLALAFDGGSLPERVRRLVGAPVRGSRRSWLVGLLALALLPAGLALRRAQEESGRLGAAGGGTEIVNEVRESGALANQVLVSRAIVDPARVSEAVVDETIVSAAAEPQGNALEVSPAAAVSGKETRKGERGSAAARGPSNLADELTRLLILKPSPDFLGELALAGQRGSGPNC